MLAKLDRQAAMLRRCLTAFLSWSTQRRPPSEVRSELILANLPLRQ
jgi:hypothetical protein